jgi:hypothetical protein
MLRRAAQTFSMLLFVAHCGGSKMNSMTPEGGSSGAGGSTTTGAGGATAAGGAMGTGGVAGTSGSTGGASNGGAGAGGGSPVKDAASDARDASPDVSLSNCQMVQCFRAINCVTSCGGPVITSGCCPCVAPAFDAIQCRDGSPAPQ